MSKINIRGRNTTKTTNYEAGESYNLSPKAELLHLTTTCLFREPKFYGTVDEQEKKINLAIQKVASKDPKFILQLANYLRNEQYMRSVSTYLLVTAANIPVCKPYVHKYTPKILNRADEINESLAMHLELFATDGKKGIPNSLKKGIIDTFSKFDEYQFSKYNRKGIVTFKDAIMLTHPKEPSQVIKKILDDNLKTPYTWETELSEKGNKPEVWERLIDSGKLPYMATLRNLRNILESGVSPEHINRVANFIKDPQKVRYSKQFPFRFLSAYKQLEHVSSPYTSKFIDAVEFALEESFYNIPHLPGTTFIASDVSGSMSWTSLSKNSSIVPAEVGLVLSAGLHKFTDNGLFGLFAEQWKTVQLPKSASILQNVDKLSNINVGGSTNGWKAIRYLNDNNIKVDRIFIFTDCQLYDDNGWGWGRDHERTIRKELNIYKQNINPDVKTYVFDLTGYGTVNFPESDRSVAEITGWSDKTFNFIELMEKDHNAQIKYIEEKY